jgi:hypothetical protein
MLSTLSSKASVTCRPILRATAVNSTIGPPERPKRVRWADCAAPEMPATRALPTMYSALNCIASIRSMVPAAKSVSRSGLGHGASWGTGVDRARTLRRREGRPPRLPRGLLPGCPPSRLPRLPQHRPPKLQPKIQSQPQPMHPLVRQCILVVHHQCIQIPSL